MPWLINSELEMFCLKGFRRVEGAKPRVQFREAELIPLNTLSHTHNVIERNFPMFSLPK